MEQFKSFDQIPNLDGESEIESTPVPTRKKAKDPADMLEAMGLSFKDKEKPNYKDFFELAVKSCGYLSEGLGKVIIPYGLYRKTFMEYFKMKGKTGSEEFVTIFDKMSRRKEIDIFSPKIGNEVFLFIPREE